jgi:hypothetical protein
MNRRCGDCTLCCRLLPVGELKKAAGERCAQQRGGGCRVYRTARMPRSCSLWNCRWLVDDETAALARPDRSHYVIDSVPDFVTARDNETGEKTPIPVLQIWVDPAHRDAHRDPALRAYLEKKEIAALIRFNSGDGLTIFPPSVTGKDHWLEITGESVPTEHTYADYVREFGELDVQSR